MPYMQTKLFLLFAFVISGSFATAQDTSHFKREIFIDGNDTLLYRILWPENYERENKFPMVVFLHGAGERGNDNSKQLTHGSKLFAGKEIREQFPAIVIFPQCPVNDSWANYKLGRDSSGNRIFQVQPEKPATRSLQLVEKLIAHYKREAKVDKKRIYIGGLSMGAMGTFEITRRNPKLFAAAFPICGATDVAIADDVKKISWWIFHGGKDDVVPPGSSIAIAAALKKEKADVKFTLYPEANHNSWDPAFAEKDLLPWLFSKRKN